jgi:hypothetical protein
MRIYGCGHLAEVRGQWLAVMDMVMNKQCQKTLGIY